MSVKLPVKILEGKEKQVPGDFQTEVLCDPQFST